jgi:hypothetical protein
VEHKAENLATEIPASVPKAPDEASSSWDYAKMGDEELEQLQEAHQKLNAPIPPALQSEIGRRGRVQVSDSRSIGSLRSNSRPVPSSDLVQSPSFAHISEKSLKALAKKERTKVIEKFALLSVAALFYSGYLIFLYAPSKGFNFQYTPVSLIGFAIGLALVLLPSTLAAYSDHPKFVWVMLVNIFFSWTIIFWIVALIWSLRGWKDRHIIARQGLSAPSELSARWSVKIFPLAVYGLIAALGIFRGIKHSLVIFQVGNTLGISQWPKVLFSLYVIQYVIRPLGWGLVFAVLFLRQWKSESDNRSVTGLLLLYLFGLFFGGWLPFISLSSLFPTAPGFHTELADFLSRFTSPESVLLSSLILVILLRRSESRTNEEEKNDEGIIR